MIQCTKYRRSVFRDIYIYLNIHPLIPDDSTSYRYAFKLNVKHLSLQQQETTVRTEYGAGCEIGMEGLDRGKVSITFRGKETRSSTCRYVSIFNEHHRLQSIFTNKFILHRESQSEENQIEILLYSAHYIISSSHTAYCSKVNINSHRMFENLEGCVPSPKPMSLRGTSSCCWWFRLLTICSQFHHLADIYVVVLQFLQRFLHCRFVRVFASKRHINIRCKQIIVFCKIFISFTRNWIKCD